MKKEKSEGDLVCMLPAYLPTKEINGKFYVEVSNLTKYVNETNEEIGRLQDEIGELRLHIEAKDEAYMKLLKDYEELKNCGEYIFDCSKYNFTWLTSTTPQLQVSKKAESGSCFTKID